jgi:electron transfer flavoprotein alpha/beta subunit
MKFDLIIAGRQAIDSDTTGWSAGGQLSLPQVTYVEEITSLPIINHPEKKTERGVEATPLPCVDRNASAPDCSPNARQS